MKYVGRLLNHSKLFERHSCIARMNESNHISDILFRNRKMEYQGRLHPQRTLTPLEFYIKRTIIKLC